MSATLSRSKAERVPGRQAPLIVLSSGTPRRVFRAGGDMIPIGFTVQDGKDPAPSASTILLFLEGRGLSQGGKSGPWPCLRDLSRPDHA